MGRLLIAGNSCPNPHGMPVPELIFLPLRLQPFPDIGAGTHGKLSRAQRTAYVVKEFSHMSGMAILRQKYNPILSCKRDKSSSACFVAHISLVHIYHIFY